MIGYDIVNEMIYKGSISINVLYCFDLVCDKINEVFCVFVFRCG